MLTEMPTSPTASPKQGVNFSARTRRRGHGHTVSPSDKFRIFPSPSRVPDNAGGLRFFVLALILFLSVSGLLAAVLRGALYGTARGRTSVSSPDVASVSESEGNREVTRGNSGISLDCALGSQPEGCGVIVGRIVVTLQVGSHPEWMKYIRTAAHPYMV